MATTALVLVPKAEAQSSLDLFLPESQVSTDVFFSAISGDGRYIGGSAVSDASGLARANRWDRAAGIVDLGSDPGANSYVTGMSYDGRVVVGYSNFSLMPGAFRWTEDGGMEYIGSLGGRFSRATDVSNDGNVVVGLARIDPATGYDDRGFVWIKDATTGVASNPQMHELPTALAWALSVEIGGVSGNGRYVIGGETTGTTPWQAYRYDVSGIQSGVVSHIALGYLGGYHATGEDISDDGSVIVGYSEIEPALGGYYHAFRWVEGATGGVASNPQMYDLGTLGGLSSWATAVSSNGAVVVGRAMDADDVVHAFRWKEDTGMLSVADWLRRAGVTVDTALADATAVSGDGNVVAGVMWDADGRRVGYVARVVPAPEPEPDPEPNPNPNPNPSPGSGIMNVEEYQASLYGAASVANAGEFLTWLPLNGAHHRPLVLTPSLSGDMCAWATGDFAHHAGNSANMALAEAGACVDLAGGSVRLGGAVGTTASWQTLALGGALNMSGQYVLGEVDWQPDGTPLLLSVTGMLGGWNAKIDRAYSNGAATSISSGSTNALGGVVRVRADWLEAAVIGNTSLNPFASLAWGGLRVDGYSESGGPFPAHFAAQALGHADIRLGLTAVTEFSSQTKLSTTLEVAHRTGTAAAAVGQVDGLFGFSLGGGTYAQTWGRLGLELDHKVNDAVSLSTSVHLATNGRDPTVAVSAGIKGAF